MKIKKVKEEMYTFDSEFQLKILALLVRDTSFLTRHREVIIPGYFDNPMFSRLCRLVLNFYYAYEATPSKESLNELVKHEFTDKEDQKNFMYLIGQIYGIPLNDIGFIEDVVVDFAKKQAYKRALIISKGYVTEGKFVDIDKVMAEAKNIGVDYGDMGDDYFDSVDVRLEYLRTQDFDDRVGTLISELDKILGGGISPGELNIIMALSGVGKSIFLINMAFAGLIQRKNVVFITLEMSKRKVEYRLDTRFTGIPKDEILVREEEYRQKLEMYSKRCSKLIVKKFPSSMATVGDIKTYLKTLTQVTGFVPDLVVVDYLDIINSGVDSLYEGQGKVAKELRGLADEFQYCLWTGTQTNRKAEGKDIITKGDKADSFTVIQDSDVVVGLMRTVEEDTEDKARISLVKMRDADDRTRVLNVSFDPCRMFIGDILETT